MTDDLAPFRMLQPGLPGAWRPLVAALRRLDGLRGADTPRAHRIREATAARRDLLAAARGLVGATPAALAAGSRELREVVTDAALLWTWFGAAGGSVLVDSHGSETIRHYPVDLPSGGREAAIVRGAVGRYAGLSAAELEARERRLLRLTGNLPVKNAIARELAAIHGEDARALFRALYGALPLREGDVEVVVTTAMVFLCMPIAGSILDTVDWSSRSEGERGAVSAWLERVRKASMQARFVRFPAFGFYEPDALDPALLARITAAVRATAGLEGVDAAVVASTLATMVVIIPSADAEKFLIHDAWGHGWQETLLEFEWLMDDLRRVDAPIGPHTGTELGEGAAPLVAAFTPAGLDEPALRRAIEANLRARIARGVNVVVAENLADLIEHKFVRQRGDERPLPTSSLLPDATLKLDLSVEDAQRMARMWSRPFRALTEDPTERARLRRELIEAGAAAAIIDRALDRALAIIAELTSPALGDALPALGGDGDLTVNAMTRVALGAATLDAAISDYLERGERRWAAMGVAPRWQCPVACVDLLALVLGCLYERARERHAWFLDEVVHNELETELERLEAAIAAEVAGPSAP